MPKTHHRIFIWDTQNENSGSFLSVPYLELQYLVDRGFSVKEWNDSTATTVTPPLCYHHHAEIIKSTLETFTVARCELLTAVLLRVQVFCNVTMCC
jgi:hypothetical protein